MTTRIPVELIFHIISFLHDNKPALSACSLCCSTLAVDIRPLLFHTLRTSLDSEAAGRFECLVESAPGIVPLIKRIDVAISAIEPATNRSAMMAISRIILHRRDEETPPALGIAIRPIVPGLRQFGMMLLPRLDQWVTSLELNQLDFSQELHFWNFVLSFPELKSLTLGSVNVGEVPQIISSPKPQISHITLKQSALDGVPSICSFLADYAPPLPSLTSLDVRFLGVPDQVSIRFGERYGPGVKTLRFGPVTVRHPTRNWENCKFRVTRPVECTTLIVPL